MNVYFQYLLINLFGPITLSNPINNVAPDLPGALLSISIFIMNDTEHMVDTSKFPSYLFCYPGIRFFYYPGTRILALYIKNVNNDIVNNLIALSNGQAVITSYSLQIL
jgi:hypothetical protein